MTIATGTHPSYCTPPTPRTYSSTNSTPQLILGSSTADSGATTSFYSAPPTPLGKPDTISRGISLRGLRRLREQLKKLCVQGRFVADMDINGRSFPGAKKCDDLTTPQLVYRWIKDPKVTRDRRRLPRPRRPR